MLPLPVRSSALQLAQCLTAQIAWLRGLPGRAVSPLDEDHAHPPPVIASTVTAIDLLDGTVLIKLSTFAQALCFGCHGRKALLVAHAACSGAHEFEVTLRSLLVWPAWAVAFARAPRVFPLHSGTESIRQTMHVTRAREIHGREGEHRK